MALVNIRVEELSNRASKEAILHGNRIHGCRNRKHLYNTHERIQIMRTQTDIHFANMEEVEVYAEIGIILLLFTIGLEFSFTNLKKNSKVCLGWW